MRSRRCCGRMTLLWILTAALTSRLRYCGRLLVIPLRTPSILRPCRAEDIGSSPRSNGKALRKPRTEKICKPRHPFQQVGVADLPAHAFPIIAFWEFWEGEGWEWCTGLRI